VTVDRSGFGAERSTTYDLVGQVKNRVGGKVYTLEGSWYLPLAREEALEGPGK
jgi:hypothetical protein